MHPNVSVAVSELSSAEKLVMAQELWNSIAANPSTVPIPDWHREVIDQRLAAFAQDGNKGATWLEVKTKVQAY